MGRPPQITKQQVLQTAREEFAQRGFDGVTLEQIGSRLGVSAAAILRYAPSKDALFRNAMSTPELIGEWPFDFLTQLSGSEDPKLILRRLAKQLIPFLEARMGEGIALWLHAGRKSKEGIGISLPPGTQPFRERLFKDVGDYFSRAAKAGRMKIKDPQLSALAFLGSLHSYAFLHRVLGANPRIPLDRYLDSLLDVWTRGAISTRRRRR